MRLVSVPHRFFVCSVVLACALAACGGDDDEPATDDAGGGTSGTGPTGGSSGRGGTGGGIGCEGVGTGTIDLAITGLPDGVDAYVQMMGGADGLLEPTESVVYEDQESGPYSVNAIPVADHDPIVRTVYWPSVLPDQFCVENRTTAQVSVSYEAIPSSNKLWTSNLLGFPSSMLAESGDADPIVVEASAGKDVAFDVDGNLWALGATVADPLIVRFPAAELGSSGVKEWDLAINVPDIACLPAVKAFTLDRSGQLWLVACGEQVMRIDSFDLGESGDVTPGIVISELPASEDVAVDADGNLWIATGSSLLRYDANHLLESSSDPADLTLTVRDAEDSRDLDPSGIAFDADGNLWGFGFGSNTVFRAAAADLEGDGEATVVSAVSISIGVDVLVARGAFDDGGGLWLSYSGGRLARLGPEQLGTSIGTGDSVVPERLVASDALGSDLRLAFFAGAAGLPLLASSYD